LGLLALKNKAESIKRVWIAHRWLLSGHLAVMSGREKRGKSTAVYDLITAAISGQSWMGAITCQQSPVLLLDYENPADYTWHNLARMLDARGVDYASVDKWYGQIDPDRVRDTASPLAAEYAIERTKYMEDRSGGGPGVVIIDTALPAWQAEFKDPGWTNNNDLVRKALDVGMAIARKSMWSVLVLYHDNKAETGAAGSYEWYATPDYYIRFRRDEDKLLGNLSIHGRLIDPPQPLEFNLLPSGLLAAEGKGTEKAEVQKEEQGQDLYDLIQRVPMGEENRINQSQVIERCRFGNRQTRDLLKIAVGLGHVHRRQSGLRQQAFYWR
jgi:hypothetical protein